MFTVSSILFLMAFLAKRTAAFSTGSGTCDATLALPAGTGGQMPGRTSRTAAASRFSLSINPPFFVAGQNHNISLSGTSVTGGFRGLLLYVEDSSTPIQRIGTLSVLGLGGPARDLACAGNVNAASTITHTTGSAFLLNQQFRWTAPATVVGPIKIFAIAYETSPALTWNVPPPLVVQISASPSSTPTMTPSNNPSRTPSMSPSGAPSTSSPSKSPSRTPSQSPSISLSPSRTPTKNPSQSPSMQPSKSPSKTPSGVPSQSPSKTPSNAPSASPTISLSPSQTPSQAPTTATGSPSRSPTTTPSRGPSTTPTQGPSSMPTQTPTKGPSSAPSQTPTRGPSNAPSRSPSMMPTMSPTQIRVECICSLPPMSLGVSISAKAVRNSTHGAILVSGPSAGWFALGFGLGMLNSPAYIFQATPARYQIGAMRQLSAVVVQSPNGFSVVSDTTAAGMRSVCVIVPTLLAYGIDLNVTSASVIFSRGAGPTLTANGHGVNRGVGSLMIGTDCAVPSTQTPMTQTPMSSTTGMMSSTTAMPAMNSTVGSVSSTTGPPRTTTLTGGARMTIVSWMGHSLLIGLCVLSVF